MSNQDQVKYWLGSVNICLDWLGSVNIGLDQLILTNYWLRMTKTGYVEYE